MKYKLEDSPSEIRSRYKSIDLSTGSNMNMISINQTLDSK